MKKIIIDNKLILQLSSIAEVFRDSTILITGATGMIGQNMVALLLEMNKQLCLGIHILAHCRNQQKAFQIFGEEGAIEDISFIFCDVCQLDYEGKIDFIIHTASITGGSKQHLDFPMNTINVALLGAKRVLDLALKSNASSIFLSSLEVYGYVGNRQELLTEDDYGYIDCTNPRSSYSESKRMCECMFAAYAKQYNLKTYIARLTPTFGYGVSAQDKRVFSQFANSILAKEDIILKSTGETIRNYCDPLDAASAFLFIMAKGKIGEAYNVANMDTEISIKDLALKFANLYPENEMQLVFDLSSDAKSLGYNAVMKNSLSSSKLMSIGWSPVYGIDEMIGHLMDSISKSNEISN